MMMTPLSELHKRNGSSRGRTLSPLCRFPVLTADDEQRLFRALQSAQRRLATRQGTSTSSRSVARARADVQSLRNRIVNANLRLLIAVAAQFKSPELAVEDLVSAGMLPLIRAVELFDSSRGFRFSTYATHAVRNHLLRVRRRRAVRSARECPVAESTVEAADASCTDGEARLVLDEELSTLRAAVGELTERDRMMVSARFGLGEYAKANTFREMAELTGLSRERVRVLTQRALQRLRESMQKSAA